MGTVFLFDMGVVVFLVGPAAGELDVILIAERHEMAVDEFRAVVGIDAQQFERQSPFNVLHGTKHPIWLFPITARLSTQVEWMSVMLSECRNSPEAELPECDTRSTSRP